MAYHYTNFKTYTNRPFRVRKNYYKKQTSNYIFDRVNGYRVLKDDRDGSIAMTVSLISESTYHEPQTIQQRCKKLEQMMGEKIPIEYAPNDFSTRKVRVIKEKFLVPLLFGWDNDAGNLLDALGLSHKGMPTDLKTRVITDDFLEHSRYDLYTSEGINHYIDSDNGKFFFSLPTLADFTKLNKNSTNFKFRRLVREGKIVARPEQLPTLRGLRVMHLLDLDDAEIFIKDIKSYDKVTMLLEELDKLRKAEVEY